MKKSFFILLIGLLILGLFVGEASAAITGTGTQDDPYKIWTYDDLKQLSGSKYASYAGDKYFELETNITFDSTWGGQNGAIGNSSYKFNGHFDGNGYQLNFSNLNLCMFYYVSACEIKNCSFLNMQMSLLTTVSDSVSVSISNINLYGCVIFSSRLTAAGIICGDCGSNVILSNISVKNCYLNLPYNSYNRLNYGILIGRVTSLNAENISISNSIIYVSTPTDSSGQRISCVAGYMNNGIMKNVFISNISMLSDSSGDSEMGCVCGYGNNLTLSNINISQITIRTKISSLDSINRISGVGYVDNTQSNLDEIHISDSNIISSHGYVAGITYWKPNSATNISVTNTNLWSDEGINNVGTFANFGVISGSSSGITNNSGFYTRLISGASLTNDTTQSSPKSIGDTVTFTVNGQQGAAVYLSTTSAGTVPQSGYTFNYGPDGSQVGDNPLTAVYSSEGTKNVSVTIKANNGRLAGSTVIGTLSSVAYIKIPLTLEDFTTNPTSESYAPISTSVTLTAVTSGGTPTSYAWSYTTDPNPSSSSTWTNIGTTSTNTTTFSPTTAGTYTFRVVASMSGASADSLEVPIKPYLYIIATLNGSGTQSDPYQVGSDSDLQQWNTYNTYYNDKYMLITQDFTPATTVSSFAGTLSGNNHTLTNSRLPLFNTLGGTVSNLKFSKAIVNGNGLLANTSSAAVSNVTAEDCFISGTTAGGLAGSATGSFTDCSVNRVTVKGTTSAGGIAAAGNMTINRCHVLNSDLLAPTTYGVCP